ncbi:hypothetical protein MA16_Dca022703 [Dendrobium catenatum]|uniref:Uncharacterized protein n=1 Tax=Dendrobium catenatum TaxID=906689 RepID=A0A2I0WE82_9ASPA|nr:hypothetical protein MA16_Dca022703 [Dendrobium catenatum]
MIPTDMLESTDIQHKLPKILGFKKSNFESPQVMESNKGIKELKLVFNLTKLVHQTAIIQTGIEGNLEFQTPQTLEAVEETFVSMDISNNSEKLNFQIPQELEAVMEEVEKEQVAVLTPSRAENNSEKPTYNDILRDCFSNSKSPSSTISLKFNKTIFLKDKKGPSLELFSSKPKLFKELQGLGPVKDQTRRRIADHKVKNIWRSSSQNLSVI